MRSRLVTLFFVVLFAVAAIGAGYSQIAPSAKATRQAESSPLPVTYVPPGKQMYKQYCASCHGVDGKGRGPVASSLRRKPTNLTTLAKSHGGSFPEEYVTNVLRFGLGFSAHGSSDMPVWGPIFQDIDNYNEAAVRQRIKNLCDFLKSIQEE